MYRLLPLLLMMLLTGCTGFTIRSAPPPAGLKAQEITRAQSATLHRLGTISVSVRGSPDDAARAIADLANAHGAAWYVIPLINETRLPGYWYATAILYGPSAASSASQRSAAFPPG